MNENSAAIAAIVFSLETDCWLEFLRCWNKGNFDSIREEWPDAPESVFVGTDPLHGKQSAIQVNEQPTIKDTTETAINIAVRFGGFDEAHHKAWVIDQMVRALGGLDYKQIVKDACHGENGAETYSWDEGITP